MTHLKRFSIPRSWPMSRKGKRFAISPSPGPHAKADCIPLRVILRDILGYADSAREAGSILNQGKVLVDKRPRRDPGFPVGLMDVIEIPDTRDFYRVVAGARGLELEKIGKDEATLKACKITGKTTLRGGIQQLNLHDGRSILVKKDTYRVGDSITISLPDQKILKHHRLEKGSHGFITAGKNMGIWGRLSDIEKREHSLEKSTVTLETEKPSDTRHDTGKREIKTLKEYIFIAERPGRPKAASQEDKHASDKEAANPKPSGKPARAKGGK
jgi:small subunit ribosomal protein S4e